MPFPSIPLHPSLVHYPIALLVLGGMAALVALWRPWPRLRAWGFASLVAGLLFTLPAVITGLMDKSGLARGSAADQMADLHTTGMFIMWALFGFAAYLLAIWREAPHEPGRRWRITVLLLAALVLLLVASHLGGRLVYELGTGVQP